MFDQINTHLYLIIFYNIQRQLEKENKELSVGTNNSSNGINYNIQLPQTAANRAQVNVGNNNNNNNNIMHSHNNNDDHSIHSNSSINDSDTVCSSNDKRSFTPQEVNFIKDKLIPNFNNEQPKQLYWRFIQEFSDWSNDAKSYNKFYQKYWMVLKQIKGNNALNNDKNNLLLLPIKKEIDTEHGKKRGVHHIIPKYPNIIPPHKKMKLQFQ